MQTAETTSRRYNVWGHREPLVFDKGLTDYVKLIAPIRALKLPVAETDILYQAAMTNCVGVEFVAFSSTRLPGPCDLPGKIHLKPCFLQDIEGHLDSDPLVQATLRMENIGRYVYDGWLPLEEVTPEAARSANGSITTSLALISMVGGQPFEWQAKYRAGQDQVWHPELSWNDIKALNTLSADLDALPASDRDNLLRSIGWLARSYSHSDCVSSYLFAVLAVESLATYVIEGPPTGSTLLALAPEGLSRTKRKNQRNDCIRSVMSRSLEYDPTAAVTEAYFNCVKPIGRKLKDHFNSIFGADATETLAYFPADKDSVGIYDLRHKIAHGDLHNLSSHEVQMVNEHLNSAQIIGKSYLRRILTMTTGNQYDRRLVKASLTMDQMDGYISRRGMYTGPTEMALIYF